MKLQIDTSDGEKGRTFTATMNSFITANELWFGGDANSDNIRPVFLTLISSEQQLRFFVTNLRIGHKATVVTSNNGYSRNKASRKLELLKTGGYKYIFQKNVDGQNTSIATIYLPALLETDITSEQDYTRCNFLCVTTKDWYVAQKQKVTPDDVKRAIITVRRTISHPSIANLSDKELENIIPIAMRFIFYLDRKIPFPLVSDSGYYLALFLYLLLNKVCSLPNTEQTSKYYIAQSDTDPWCWARFSQFASFQEHGLSDLGFMPSIACSAPIDLIRKLLGDFTSAFYENNK